MDSIYPKAVQFWRNDNDSVNIYTKELYKRAKISGAPELYLRAYHIKALTSLNEQSESYTDSLFSLAKSENDFKFLASAYFLKGRNAYDAGAYKKSLDNYLQCQSLLQKEVDSIPLERLVKDNIGLIRILVGDNKGAISIFEELLPHYREVGDFYHVETLFSLAVAYHQDGNFQKSQEYVAEGLDLSTQIETGPEPYFLSILGANQYGLGQYQDAIENLEAANTSFEENGDPMRQAISHYYLGKIYDALKVNDSTLYHMHEVDRLYREHPQSLYPLTRGAWEMLLDEARRSDDGENELRYITTLLAIDSIVSSNFRYINQNLTQRYDMPKLVQEQEDLKKGYQRRNRFLWYGLGGVSLLLLSFFVFARIKRKSSLVPSTHPSSIKSKKQKRVVLTTDRLSQISDGLAKLEAEEFFLKPNITMKEVADLLGTNDKYLSVYVNRHIGSSYSTYVNKLRLDRFMNRLKTEPDFFKKYTLDAMAQQCGFTSNKALNKACKRILGKTSSEILIELGPDNS
ncbi:MAG: helix-turn-helix domain-containing protein [Bacteroidota bacterium]